MVGGLDLSIEERPRRFHHFVTNEFTATTILKAECPQLASMPSRKCLKGPWFEKRATVETVAIPRVTIVFTTVCANTTVVYYTAMVYDYTTSDTDNFTAYRTGHDSECVSTYLPSNRDGAKCKIPSVEPSCWLYSAGVG